MIEPPASLGVIGGGQLGRMFMIAAKQMGYRTVVLSERAESPATQVADEIILGRSDSVEALSRLAERTRAVTVEFENVSAAGMRWLSRRVPVRPGWKTVHISQNRIREKTFLQTACLPVAPWRAIRCEEDVPRCVEEIGPNLILKTAASGYDGKGQVRVASREEAMKAWHALGEVPCVAEAVVAFQCEISVIVVRGLTGEVVTYAPARNHHERHILDSTIMPAPLGPRLTQIARQTAVAVAEALETIGVLTIEFFVTHDDRILVNEIAPRPHNSGHLTIEAAETSQFEQQVRALCGLPLGSADMRKSAAMVNLLGDLWEAGPPPWSRALALDSSAKLHLYGKGTAKVGRKMGHLTVTDDHADRALARALAARDALRPGPTAE